MDDTFFMREALSEARKVEGKTGENPAVGCVIVKNGQIVARGATQPPGGSHAEVAAVEMADRAGHALEGCDFYVTLEPCTFQGRTPPCSSMLVAQRPHRVIVGIRDPHPLVRGRGLAELRGAAIEVVEDVMAEEISQMLAGWLERNSEDK